MAEPYPPLTPMNCRFFFVEGDPGSPSAFRFMMDLREDGGDEAGKPPPPHQHGSSRLWKNSALRMFSPGPVTCGGAFLCVRSLC